MNEWFTINPKIKEKFTAGCNYNLQVSTNLNYYNLEKFNKSRKMVDDFLIVRCLNGNETMVSVY